MNKYFKIRNYLNIAFDFSNRYLMSHFELLFTARLAKPLRYPPIFFLGAPRSGSTLAFQAITNALDVGYISNAHCSCYGAPSLWERMFHSGSSSPQSDYTSNHGVTKGRHAPSECGAWWYRFFRRKPPYVTLNDVDNRKKRAFRRSVAALVSAFDRPVVFKNLYASLRIQIIADCFPESLFIVIHRNELENGHSLLEARKRLFGCYETWFSVEPSNISDLILLPAHEQVIEQIRYIHQTIDNDLSVSNVQSGRRFDFEYEKFCDDPIGTLNALRSFLANNGCNVDLRKACLPSKFEQRTDIRIDNDIYEAMAAYVGSTEKKDELKK